jgi:hypothetical protein
MHMPGMRIGHGLNLLPVWLGVVAALAFLAIAASHLRHMWASDGQRRPWHACHVVIAIGMVFMFLPASLDPLAVPLGFWRVAFACAGLVAALWAAAGNARVPVLMWTLTAFDLGAMLYMWSVPDRPGTAAVSWLLVAYLVGSAGMWAVDAYRRIDGGAPLVSWQALGGGGGELVATTPVSLIGELDIGISMIAMAIGMAYMVLAMQLMS